MHFSFTKNQFKRVQAISGCIALALLVCLVSNACGKPFAGVSPSATTSTSASSTSAPPGPASPPSPGSNPSPSPSPSPAPSPTPGVANGGPVIFYTDLESGPNTGGKNNEGAIVSLYGRNFGNTQGTSTVTLANLAIASYVSWADSKISVAIGNKSATGNIVVHLNSSVSNGMPFTVRTGNIYFVSTSGDDGSVGTYLAPWKSLLHARDTIKAGDIIYALDGVSQLSDDGQGWRSCILLRNGGTVSLPMALIAYPNATVTIGSTSGPDYGIRGGGSGNWVIAGLKLRTNGTAALSLGGDHLRVVGNDITCPNGTGSEGCAEFAQSNFIYFLGNNVYESGKNAVNTKLYHQVYFTTDTNHVWAGYNQIHDNGQCRAIQFHSSPLDSSTGYSQYDLHVFSNLIYNDPCDGINFATVDPSKGVVEAYNNLIYHVGQGPSPRDSSANYAGIYSADITNTGSAGSGTIEIYNNTIYDVGQFSVYNGDNGAINKDGSNSNLKLRLRNNLISLTGAENYFASSSGNGISQIFGDHNLFYGSSVSIPQQTTANVTGAPLFSDTANGDFHLKSGSPAANAGDIIQNLFQNFEGASRNPSAPYSLGAY